jgi:hypothetical protein
MAEVVNLRRVRKAKARQTADAQAEVKRSMAGRTKAERQTSAREHDRSERHLDGHRRFSQQPGEESLSDDDG